MMALSQLCFVQENNHRKQNAAVNLYKPDFHSGYSYDYYVVYTCTPTPFMEMHRKTQ